MLVTGFQKHVVSTKKYNAVRLNLNNTILNSLSFTRYRNITFVYNSPQRPHSGCVNLVYSSVT